MARNGKSPKASSKNPSDWRNFEFVQINLSDADKTHFGEMLETAADELDDAMATLLESQYKLSVTYDERNSCFIASLTAKHETDDNWGYVLPSRQGDMWSAIRLAAFKHVHMCKDGVWPKEREGFDW